MMMMTLQPEKSKILLTDSNLILICCVSLFISLPLNAFSPSFSKVANEMGYMRAIDRDMIFASYLALSLMTGQILGSFFGGYFSDVHNRKSLLVASISIETACLFLFGIPQYVTMFYTLRFLTGFCQAFAIPVIFSIIGDVYVSEKRVIVSAAASSCIGGGTFIGQLFCGVLFQYYSWRFPFVIFTSLGCCCLLCIHCLLKEPIRESSTHSSIDGKLVITETGFSYQDLYRSCCVPTIVLIIIQTIPGTIPWGILSTHLQDLLTIDFNISIYQATMLMGAFGIGGAVGGIASGLLGGFLYSWSRVYLPVFMGTTCIGASLLLRGLLTRNINFKTEINTIVALLVLSGAMAAVSGTNIRTVIINVSSPRYRGSLIGFLNVLNCIGRGIGPSLTGMYMTTTSSSRAEAVTASLYLWVLSGFVLSLGGFTITRDEEHARAGVKKYASITDDLLL
jgi:MFS family permease